MLRGANSQFPDLSRRMTTRQSLIQHKLTVTQVCQQQHLGVQASRPAYGLLRDGTLRPCAALSMNIPKSFMVYISVRLSIYCLHPKECTGHIRTKSTIHRSLASCEGYLRDDSTIHFMPLPTPSSFLDFSAAYPATIYNKNSALISIILSAATEGHPSIRV